MHQGAAGQVVTEDVVDDPGIVGIHEVNAVAELGPLCFRKMSLWSEKLM